MADREFIKDVLDNIRRAPVPGLFDMEDWAQRKSCGTAMCFAGWTVHTNGDKIVFYDDEISSVNCMSRSGKIHNIEERARDLLDLTRYQADEIFSATSITDVDQLEGFINEVLAEDDEDD